MVAAKANTTNHGLEFVRADITGTAVLPEGAMGGIPNELGALEFITDRV